METKHVYQPVKFFLITFLITFLPSLPGIYFSYQPGMEGITTLCIIIGMFSPLIAAAVMILGSRDGNLRKDFRERLSLKRIRPAYLAFLLLVMPAVLILGTALSVLLGHSADQFKLSSEFTVMAGQFWISLLIMFLAPTVEELGWRGYGVDSLRSKFNLFTATLLFALLWSLWHLPLFFVNGYYQNELLNTSMVYVVNFFVQLLAAAFIMNWVYYKNNRSITAIILLHFMLVIFSELLQTEQFTKCIIGALMLLVAAVLVIADRKQFFSNTKGELSS